MAEIRVIRERVVGFHESVHVPHCVGEIVSQFAQVFVHSPDRMIVTYTCMYVLVELQEVEPGSEEKIEHGFCIEILNAEYFPDEMRFRQFFHGVYVLREFDGDTFDLQNEKGNDEEEQWHD